jgi:hypothetical protein
MTVPASNDRLSGVYVASGGETVLAYDFRVLSGADLAVWRRRSGIDARLLLTTDYTVSGVGAAEGGSVTLAAAAIAGDLYLIEGARPQARTSDLVYAQALPPATLNAELDSLQMQLVELREKIERALTRSRFDGPAAATLELPPARANTLIGFGDDAVLHLYDRDDDGAIVIGPGDLDFAIKDRDLSAPPGSPAVGDQYLIKPPGSGAWAGQTGKARWTGLAWSFTENARGQLHWVEDENQFFTWNGAILKEVTGRSLRDINAIDHGLDAANGAAANTTAMNAAIARADELGGARIVVPRGIFRTNAWNTISSNSTVIQGVERFTSGTEFRFANAGGNCITFAEKGHMGLRDLYLSTDVKRTSGAAVRFEQGCFAPRVERVRCDFHWDGFDVGPSAQVRIIDCLFRYLSGSWAMRVLGLAGVAGGIYGMTARDCTSDNPYVHPIGDMRGAWQASTSYDIGDLVTANGRIWQCNVSGGSGATAPSAIPGTTRGSLYSTPVADGTTSWLFVSGTTLTGLLHDSYANSVSVMDSEFIGGGHGVRMRDSAAASGSAPRWLNSFNLETDHSFGHGVSLEAGKNFYATQGWFGSSLSGCGVNQAAAHQGVSIEGTRIVGNWQHGGLFDGIGIVLTGVEAAVNSQAELATYHGLAFGADARRITVQGCRSGWDPDGFGRQGYGLHFHGDADQWIATGNQLGNNHTGALSGTADDTTRFAANNVP